MINSYSLCVFMHYNHEKLFKKKDSRIMFDIFVCCLVLFLRLFVKDFYCIIFDASIINIEKIKEFFFNHE